MYDKKQRFLTGISLDQDIERAVKTMGFSAPTPVQEKTIPAFLDGGDLIVQAPTGTGKTGAFGIPIAQRLDVKARGTQVLILSPTRELAIQIAGVLKELTQFRKGLRVVTLYGGEYIQKQLRALRAEPQILVATPGRLSDHIRRGSVRLHKIKTVVLDEADRMLDMGFRDDIASILALTPKERQTVMFSATLPQGILEIARTYQRNAVQISIEQEMLTVNTVKQFYTPVAKGAKMHELMALLNATPKALSLVFVNTKSMADSLCEDLKKQNLRTDALHGDIHQQKRERIMKSFRTGKLDVLVATDVAARGIDVGNINLVINYDIPSDSESYVHRIGRTGRANRSGTAYTLIYRREAAKMDAIIRDTKADILRKQPSLAKAV